MTYNLKDLDFSDMKARARRVIGDEHGAISAFADAIQMNRVYFTNLFVRDKADETGEGAKEPGAIRWLARFCEYKGVDPGWLLGLSGYNQPFRSNSIYAPRRTEEAERIANAVDEMDIEYRQIIMKMADLVEGLEQEEEAAERARLSQQTRIIKSLVSLIWMNGTSDTRSRVAKLLSESGIALDEWSSISDDLVQGVGDAILEKFS